jgi:hypothetical protein
MRLCLKRWTREQLVEILKTLRAAHAQDGSAVEDVAKVAKTDSTAENHVDSAAENQLDSTADILDDANSLAHAILQLKYTNSSTPKHWMMLMLQGDKNHNHKHKNKVLIKILATRTCKHFLTRIYQSRVW